MELFAADGHDAGGCERVTGKSGMRPRYISGLLHATSLLEGMIANETKEAVELTNRITIEIHAASYRSIRGYTVVAAICDEIAFWRTDDSANPDTEILHALRPTMATVPGGLMLCISSPYARRGELYRAYRDHYGRASDVLVWQADTRTMNPTVPETFITEAYPQDAAVAAAEYGAEFRRDIESFVSREAVEACVIPGRRALPPVSGTTYRAFTDPSGGNVDSMTLAIAHHEGGVAVLDTVRERRSPFSPSEVVGEFAALLTQYGVSRVVGDRYGGEFPRELFRTRGIDYQLSDRTKSDLYRELLPLVNSRMVELLDDPRLLSQLLALERRTSRAGKDAIDHPPGRGSSSHDDAINAAAGALVLVAR